MLQASSSRRLMQKTKQNTHIRTLNPKTIHPLLNHFYMCVCVCVCLYECVNVYVLVYIFMYVSTYIYIYIYHTNLQTFNGVFEIAWRSIRKNL